MADTGVIAFIAEEAAKRMESGNWKQMGNFSFSPVLFFYPENRSKLCLVDTLALESAKYAYSIVERDNCLRMLIDLEEDITSILFPALREVILQDIADNRKKYFNVCNIQLRENNAVSGSSSKVHYEDLGTIQLIFFYNDALCDGGPQAAGILRKAIKEL